MKKIKKNSRTHARDQRAHVEAPVNRSNLTSERSFTSPNHTFCSDLRFFRVDFHERKKKKRSIKKVSLSTDKLCHLRSIWPSYLFNLIYDVSSLFRHEWQLHSSLSANFRCRYQFIYTHNVIVACYFSHCYRQCTHSSARYKLSFSRRLLVTGWDKGRASNSYARKLGHLFTASHHHHCFLAFVVRAQLDI